MNTTLPTVEAVRAALAGSPVVHPPASGITPESLDIHRLVKQWFQTATLDDIWEVGKEQLTKARDKRLLGKRAAQRVQQARAAQVRKGRTPYYPAGWVVLTSKGLAP